MNSYRIPIDEWHSFCAWFTRRHRGVRLVVERPGKPDEVAVRGRLNEISVEQQERGPEIQLRITMDTRQSPGPYSVEDPAGIELAQQDPPMSDTLRISSASGEQEVVLRFDEPLRIEAAGSSALRQPMRPDGKPRPVPNLWKNTHWLGLLVVVLVLLVIVLYYFVYPAGWTIAPDAPPVPASNP